MISELLSGSILSEFIRDLRDSYKLVNYLTMSNRVFRNVGSRQVLPNLLPTSILSL